jgi:hypothetical protein
MKISCQAVFKCFEPQNLLIISQKYGFYPGSGKKTYVGLRIQGSKKQCCGSAMVSMQMQIQFQLFMSIRIRIRIRIQTNADPDQYGYLDPGQT